MGKHAVGVWGAIGLIITGSLCAGIVVLVYFNPSESTTAALEHLSGKLILSLLVSIALFFCGLVALRLFYVPTARRLICNMTLLLVASAFAMAGPISLNNADVHLTYNEADLPVVLFRLADNKADVSEVFSTLVTGIVCLVILYLLAAFLKIDSEKPI